MSGYKLEFYFKAVGANILWMILLLVFSPVFESENVMKNLFRS